MYEMRGKTGRARRRVFPAAIRGADTHIIHLNPFRGRRPIVGCLHLPRNFSSLNLVMGSTLKIMEFLFATSLVLFNEVVGFIPVFHIFLCDILRTYIYTLIIYIYMSMYIIALEIALLL